MTPARSEAPRTDAGPARRSQAGAEARTGPDTPARTEPHTPAGAGTPDRADATTGTAPTAATPEHTGAPSATERHLAGAPGGRTDPPVPTATEAPAGAGRGPEDAGRTGQWQAFKQEQTDRALPLVEAEARLETGRTGLDEVWRRGYDTYTAHVENDVAGRAPLARDGAEARHARWQWRGDITRAFRAELDRTGRVSPEAYTRITENARANAYKYLVGADQTQRFTARFRQQADAYRAGRFTHGEDLPRFEGTPAHVYDGELRTYVKDDIRRYGYAEDTVPAGPPVDLFRDRTHDFNPLEQYYIGKREDLAGILDRYRRDGESGGGLPAWTGLDIDALMNGVGPDLERIATREHDIRTATAERFDDIVRWNGRGGEPLPDDLVHQVRLDFQRALRADHDLVFAHGDGEGPRELWHLATTRAVDELPGRIAREKFVRGRLTEERAHAERELGNLGEDVLSHFGEAARQRVAGEYLDTVRTAAGRHFTERWGESRETGKPAPEWTGVRDRLRSTLPDRVRHEGDLQAVTGESAHTFHKILGHPGDFEAFPLHEDTVSRLGDDFRTEHVAKYDELFAPEGHRTDVWLAHESRHEDGFRTRLDDLRDGEYLMDFKDDAYPAFQDPRTARAAAPEQRTPGEAPGPGGPGPGTRADETPVRGTVERDTAGPVSRQAGREDEGKVLDLRGEVRERLRSSTEYAFTAAQIDRAHRQLLRERPALADLGVRERAALVARSLVRPEEKLIAVAAGLLAQHTGVYGNSGEIHQAHQRVAERFGDRFEQLSIERRARIVVGEMLDHARPHQNDARPPAGPDDTQVFMARTEHTVDTGLSRALGEALGSGSPQDLDRVGRALAARSGARAGLSRVNVEGIVGDTDDAEPLDVALSRKTVPGPEGRDLAGLLRNSGAQRRERDLSERFDTVIGPPPGAPVDAGHFSHSMLDTISTVLHQLPAAHVRGNFDLKFIKPARDGNGSGTSAYDWDTKGIEVVVPKYVPDLLYTTLNRGNALQRRLMDEVLLASYEGVGKESDAALGISGRDRHVMGGVSDVLAHGNLLEWTLRHEIGHSLEALSVWQILRAEERFGGWKQYEAQPGFVTAVAEELLSFHRITEEERNLRISNVPLYQRVAQVLLPSRARNRPDLLPGLLALPDASAALQEKLDQIVKFARLAVAQPWTLNDGGAGTLSLAGRVYHVDPYGNWVSYLQSQRERYAVSNYQFSNPDEWFAEAYAAYYDPNPEPRARLNPDVRRWFRHDLTALLETGSTAVRRRTAGDAFETLHWLQEADPHQEQGGDPATRRVLAALTADMSLRDGVPHRSPPPAAVGTRQDGTEALDARTRLATYLDRSPDPVPDIATVVRAMSSAPSDARGLLVTEYGNGDIDQVINVTRDRDGKVRFMDGRTGSPVPEPAGAASFLPTTDDIPGFPLRRATRTATGGTPSHADPAPRAAGDLLDAQEFRRRTAARSRSLSRITGVDKLLADHQGIPEDDVARRADLLDQLIDRAHEYAAGTHDGGNRAVVQQLIVQAERQVEAYRELLDDRPAAEAGRMSEGTSAGPRRLPYRERVELARRTWDQPLPEAVTHLEDLLRQAGTGARSLVTGVRAGEALWAVNREGTIQWLTQDLRGTTAPARAAAPVRSVDLAPSGRLIAPVRQLAQAGDAATRFCGISPGADLRHVL
ncbi:hypothetical protein AB0G32_38145 [Streptomyces sp. NPDC023723]|uniref:hypothetical protein n=1 Tax=Streptomyces sp. NPDC023723 TaxID=3154323 RepID=UPI0033DD3B59